MENLGSGFHGQIPTVLITSETNGEMTLFCFLTLYVATPCGPGEEKMSEESESFGALVLCEECGSSFKTLKKYESPYSDRTKSTMCEVCGRRSLNSRQFQNHKMEHHRILVLIYFPTLAVHLQRLGTEMLMCNRYVAHTFVV